jgi:hypothetical protein
MLAKQRLVSTGSEPFAFSRFHAMAAATCFLAVYFFAFGPNS